MSASIAADRLVVVHLTDPTHRMPIPGQGRLFPTDDAGEKVDSWDPFWIGCIKDKSVTLGTREPPLGLPKPAEPDAAQEHEAGPVPSPAAS